MNTRTRRVALYALAAIAMAASANALAHSYAGLYAWAVHHRLTGWQAMSWPAEIDVFLAVGELALYVAYLDGWPVRQRVWPWVTALVGLVVSVAGNIGHIQPVIGHPVSLTDRMTAATSPLAAFAGLTVGLLVLRMNRQQAARAGSARAVARVFWPLPAAAAGRNGQLVPVAAGVSVPGRAAVMDQSQAPAANGTVQAGGPHAGAGTRLLEDANRIYQTAAAHGQQLSQRALARQLRGRGHRFPQSAAARDRGGHRPAARSARYVERQVDDMDQIDQAAIRLHAADSTAATLGAGFDAFEVIRVAARDCEDRAPELFAAFILAAGAAVEGRNALAAAPSLPRSGGETANADAASLSADVAEVADALADLSGLLATRLQEAAAHTGNASDGTACRDAAGAAAQIHQFLGAGDDAHVR
ncbi:MAG: hypothetical protein ACM3ML_11100 [Micromonosporaceae bacterium]